MDSACFLCFSKRVAVLELAFGSKTQSALYFLHKNHAHWASCAVDYEFRRFLGLKFVRLVARKTVDFAVQNRPIFAIFVVKRTLSIVKSTLAPSSDHTLKKSLDRLLSRRQTY